MSENELIIVPVSKPNLNDDDRRYLSDDPSLLVKG